MEREVMMEKEGNDDRRIDHFFKEFIGERYYKIDRGLEKCTTDIKDIHLTIERLRREVAVEFVSHMTLDLFKVNEQIQMTALGQEINHFKDEIQRNQQRNIGRLERIWLHVGSVGVVIGVVIVLLEYLQRVH